jgi:hypothetical protein
MGIASARHGEVPFLPLERRASYGSNSRWIGGHDE